MVFVSFFGLRKDKFSIGRSVMPKFFLEDVGNEDFSLVMSGKRKVAVSDMPRIMVECFLEDYIGVDDVHARELKVVFGYFVGLMAASVALTDDKIDSHAIGIGCPGRPSVYDQLLSGCKVRRIVYFLLLKNTLILHQPFYEFIFYSGFLK